MTQKLDYSREDAMEILNNQNYSDEDKKQIYEKYMSDLKKKRKDAIVSKLNDLAMNNPIITKEIYIAKLKEYETDDLSKPFEIIEKELMDFENQMKNKYNEYLKTKQQEEMVEITPDVKPEVVEEETFDDTIFSDPFVEEDEEEEVVPSLVIKDDFSVLNEEPETLAKPLFDSSSEETEEIMPDEFPDNEKGNASAIILSIIAIIIGVVVMYSIIRLN